MIEKIRYTKTGKRINIYQFESKLHQKIVMKKTQFYDHIIIKHPEITLDIINEVLKNPDLVTKQSKSKKEHFYQKEIEKLVYIVVVSSHKNIKRIRFILTAFSVNNSEFLRNKNIYLRYINKWINFLKQFLRPIMYVMYNN